MRSRVVTHTPVNRSHPLAEGLVAWWYPAPWIAGGSKLYDLIGRQPATLSGGYGWVGTPLGPAVTLDGSSAYLNAPAGRANIFGTGDLTAIVAVYPTSLASEICLYDTLPNLGAGVRNGSFVFVQTSGTLRIFTDGFYKLASASTITANAWNHCVFRRRNGTCGYAINGVVDATAYSYTGGWTTGDLVSGRYADSLGGWLPGKIGTIQTYNRALSDQEIRAAYDEWRGGFRSLLTRDRSRVIYAPAGSGWYANQSPVIGCGVY